MFTLSWGFHLKFCIWLVKNPLKKLFESHSVLGKSLQTKECIPFFLRDSGFSLFKGTPLRLIFSSI